ncbi:hypothetical protein V2J09_004403 [Rumex salicifolius]
MTLEKVMLGWNRNRTWVNMSMERHTANWTELILNSHGSATTETSMFPEVDSTWKVFNELQSLLSKTNGKLVADVMTSAPVVVRETTNLEDAARLLLETRYRRLPVVDAGGELVGIITRGDVVRAALKIKRTIESNSQ